MLFDDDIDDTYEQNNINEDEIELIRPVSVSYRPDVSYTATYLDSVYEPEKYNEYKNIRDDFKKAFKISIDKNPAYDVFRVIDKDLLKPGDIILVGDGSKKISRSIQNQWTILEINDENFVIIQNSITKIEKSANIIPLDDILYKVSIDVKSKLYSDIISNMSIKNLYNVFYFDIFCDYFKTHTKDLFNSIDILYQETILKELNNSTGCFNKNNIKPLW
jgi:hypothetical protein